MLYTKCILHPKERLDGLRISVMSRHTLSDGVSIDPRITFTSFDEWYIDLAPPAALVGAYYKKGLPWDAFAEAYLAYLRQPSLLFAVEDLARRAFREDITLLCIEENAAQCHRGLLAQECQWYVPQLDIMHR